MSKRKIKNWFEFFVRLLPLFILMGYFIYMYGYFRSGGAYASLTDVNTWVTSLNTNIFTFTTSSTVGSFFNQFATSLYSFVGCDSALFKYLCYTICYEIIVEFVLLSYNFIMLPFKWANSVFDKE